MRHFCVTLYWTQGSTQLCKELSTLLGVRSLAFCLSLSCWATDGSDIIPTSGKEGFLTSLQCHQTQPTAALSTPGHPPGQGDELEVIREARLFKGCHSFQERPSVLTWCCQWAAVWTNTRHFPSLGLIFFLSVQGSASSLHSKHRWDRSKDNKCP